MAISVISGFSVTSAQPADLKTILASSSSLTSISASWRYDGMTVYCQADDSEWALVGGVANSNWIQLAKNGIFISSSYSSTSSYALNGGGLNIVTGSTLPITSSYSLTSSYISSSNIIGTISTASYANTASYLIGYSIPSIVTSSISSSFASSSISSSYVATASFYPNTVLSASWVSASVFITTAQTASYISVTNLPQHTSSWSINTLTASSINFIPSTAISASFSSQALTASYLIGYTTPILVSSSISSSFASSSISASYVASASYYPTFPTLVASASWVPASVFIITAQTASYITASNIIGTTNSSSYSLSSSYSNTSSYSLTASYSTTASISNIASSLIPNASVNGNIQVGGYSNGVFSPTITQLGFGQNTNATNSFSVIIGDNAAFNNTNPVDSVIIGYQAGQNSTTASYATQIGYQAGQNSTTATNATQIGYQAGYNSATGSNSTVIGYQADALTPSSNIQNSIAIGYKAKVSTPNTCVIGGTGSNAVSVSIGSTTAVNTLDVTGNISCSVITASLFLGTASYATTCSTYIYSNITQSFTYLTQSQYAYSSSWVSASAFITTAQTASYVTSSNIYGLISTASYAATSSYIPNINSIGVYLITSSGNQTNLLVTQQNTGSYDAGFFDYLVKSGSNSRAGTLFGTWNNGSISYSETSNVDLGNTSDATMSLNLINSNVQVTFNTILYTNWTIKLLSRYL